jgi:hypothetical protein
MLCSDAGLSMVDQLVGLFGWLRERARCWAHRKLDCSSGRRCTALHWKASGSTSRRAQSASSSTPTFVARGSEQ